MRAGIGASEEQYFKVQAHLHDVYLAHSYVEALELRELKLCHGVNPWGCFYADTGEYVLLAESLR